MLDDIKNYLQEVKRIADIIDIASIEAMANIISNIKDTKGRIFFIGVGGSAANCSHAVNDFRKILGIESYAAVDNVSELTARINDEGWSTSFANWLKVSNLRQNDAVFILSVGGGNEYVSKNIVTAIDFALDAKCNILSIVSRDGGYSGANSTACVLVPVVSDDRITPHAEEWQAIIWHLLVTVLKDTL
jgi:D-sedoheptulose 7-phosphate isomerase